MLARAGGHAVGEQIFSVALVNEVEGAVEVVVLGSVGKDVLVKTDDEFVAVAAHAHVVVECAGDEGEDFVVADGGVEAFGFVKCSSQLLCFGLHVAEHAVDNAVDVAHDGVFGESDKEIHEVGVVGLEVEQVGAELVADIGNLVGQLVGGCAE